jgi:hypothetical protein
MTDPIALSADPPVPRVGSSAPSVGLSVAAP